MLSVKMLGGFSMYYGDKAVMLKKIENSKSVRLLQMLLLSLQSGIPKNELIDCFYGWNEKIDRVNRNKNLNKLIYRLEKQLVDCGLPAGRYIEIKEGICRFKSRIPIELDTQKFEEMIGMAEDAEGEKRIELLSRANEMYRGDILPENQSEAWFLQKSNYFKKLYVKTIRELEKEYIRKNDYKNRMLLYSRAVSIYPFDNWQTSLIRCNLELYRYEEARNIYNSAVELYMRELDSSPAEEMQQCFEKFELKDGNHIRSPGGINKWKDMDKSFMGRRSEIKKAMFEETEVKGAYYCIYPSFVDYCRLVARAKDRSQFESMLMFLTLSQKGEAGSQKQMDLQEQMQLLKKVIGDSLRIGDAYTRYGNRHYILMLAHSNKDFCSSIFERIERAYVKSQGKGTLWYYADMTQELKHAVP
ncbi:bacterial transcriptional activator domain-containing protein [Roseburia hominis]